MRASSIPRVDDEVFKRCSKEGLGIGSGRGAFQGVSNRVQSNSV